MPEQVTRWRQEMGEVPAEILLAWAADAFPGRVAFASSLGLEDQALTDMIARHAPEIEVFTLDTGRLFPETYDLLQRTREHYGIRIGVAFPDASEVEEMVAQHGPNCFRQSVEMRERCCRVRKVKPLRRALSRLDAWICGLRRGQSLTRSDLQAVEWDAANDLVKISPLAAWSESDVWKYIREHAVPYNPLHDRGYPSIGCACCTRAVQEGEDVRAGRWWWEKPEKRECGLHGGKT